MLYVNNNNNKKRNNNNNNSNKDNSNNIKNMNKYWKNKHKHGCRKAYSIPMLLDV